MVPRTPAKFLRQLRAIAIRRGGVLLSPAYRGDTIPHRWRCARGHVFEQPPSKVKQGRWCNRCGRIRAGMKKKAPTEARLRRLVAERGAEILTTGYADSTTPMRFRCGLRHEWMAAPQSLFQGTWCPECSRAALRERAVARVLPRLQGIARGHGGEVTGTVPGKGPTRYELKCAKGHTWTSIAATIDRGGWCKACEPDFYLERLHRIAREHGGELLSARYVNEDVGLWYRCAAGHRFRQRPGVTVTGAWCRRCGSARQAEKKRASARARLYDIVRERGGAVLSPEYMNNQTHLRFRCARGHEWRTLPSVVLRGGWCGVCRWIDFVASPGQHAGRFAEQLVEVRARLDRIVRKRGGEFLPPGYRGYKHSVTLRCAKDHTWRATPLSIDEGRWCPECRETERLAEYRLLADREGGECLATRCRNGKQPIAWRCRLGHEFTRTGNAVRLGRWCFVCRKAAPSSLERMHRIARERGGECRSPRYLGMTTRLKWRCREGHTWNMQPSEVVAGHWCPTCGRFLPYSRKRLSIDDMRQTAAERGGRCDSKEYFGNKAPLRWRCARGHTWRAHPNRVRQGSWCPVCAHSVLGTLEGIRAHAASLGGRCLSRTWDDHTKAVRFECARGHCFHLQRGAIKSGVWCTKCGPVRKVVR